MQHTALAHSLTCTQNIDIDKHFTRVTMKLSCYFEMAQIFNVIIHIYRARHAHTTNKLIFVRKHKNTNKLKKAIEMNGETFTRIIFYELPQFHRRFTNKWKKKKNRSIASPTFVRFETKKKNKKNRCLFKVVEKLDEFNGKKAFLIGLLPDQNAIQIVTVSMSMCAYECIVILCIYYYSVSNRRTHK